jgi:hypothetical protein
LENTEKLQKDIKEIIAKLGWSQNRLAREIYMSENAVDNDDEITRFEGKLKKELFRSTTKPERLNEYLDIIARHPEFEKLDIIIPRYHSSGILSEEMETGMKKISLMISKKL